MTTGKKKNSKPVYKNPTKSIDERIHDLISRMTLEEKIYQMGAIMGGSWDARIKSEFLVNGKFSTRKAARLLTKGIGHICIPLRHLSPGKSASLANSIQRFLINNTRLGIPAIIHDESLHGCVARGSTSFPQSIGLASIWDGEFMEKVAVVIGKETGVRGIQQCLSPTINIARDPRCGRTEETYGEDPYLTTRMAVAFVKGVQSQGVAATIKHFAANFIGDGGRDSHEIHFSERILREIYFPAFEVCVKEAGVMSIMPAYNAIDGMPCACDRWLLTDVLRHEWGFDGVAVSDYGAVSMIHDYHHLAETLAEAGRKAAEAGMDVELPELRSFKAMINLAQKGKVSIDAINTATARVLRQKFRQRLFDNPYVNVGNAAKLTGCTEHKQIALEAARKSIVLLKNEGNILPLKKAGSFAVIGPNASVGRLGGYSTTGIKVVSPIEGIRKTAGKRTKLTFAKGCDLVNTSKAGFRRAVDVADKSDIAVMFVGNSAPDTEGEQRDRCRLELPGVQEDLILEVAKTGTPVVVVLINGSAIAMERWIDSVKAVVEAWYPGMEGGTAIAQVLFGSYNPGGKLPLTFPRTTGQLPLYYNMKPSGRVYDYVDQRGDQPLFPFGHGLSYTTFKYSKLMVTPKAVSPNGTVKISVEVQNAGKRAGEEVVQLYLNDLYASISRPIKELKRFRRIALKPGQKKRVEFALSERDFAFLDKHLEYVIEPGTFELMIGGSSEKGLKARFRVK